MRAGATSSSTACSGFDRKTKKRKEMSAIGQEHIINLIKMFNSYALKDGDQFKIIKKDVKAMMQTEFPAFFTGANKKDMDQIVSSLDLDEDGKMDFPEFIIMISSVCILTFSYIES
ncbi:protein S100-A1-like [Seriola aureovittata]|uniref:protein S100-A1-like n=1 Tax=Seriola aureovittata TaxID=2871759 RepID=UPI0024BEC488|nr:protein S100-A1-like [Seriola aureovittata]